MESKDAPPDSFLRTFMQAQVDLMEQHTPNALHGFNSLNHFILTHGREFEPGERPADVSQGEMGKCFANAFHMVEAAPERYVYCEGIGQCFIPTEHAWVWDRELQQVVDPTWRSDWEQKPTAYLGIPFQWQYVFDTVMEQTTYGVIDNPSQRWPLLGHDAKDFLAVLD